MTIIKNHFHQYIPFITLIQREILRIKRLMGQVLIAPTITASLYIFIFGYILGKNITNIHDVPYINFVFPGVFGMNLIISVFSGTSFAFFMLKFQKTIEDFFTLPISFTNIVLSQLVSGMIRGFFIMIALSFVGILFGVATLIHPFLLLLYVLLISFMFGLIGIVVGIWADDSFEKISIATNFILTPLSFLGGAFYSVGMLPTYLQFLVHFNPIFYAIDGIRYCFTGFHDVSLILGIVILSVISIIFLGIVVFIFKTGWKLRR